MTSSFRGSLLGFLSSLVLLLPCYVLGSGAPFQLGTKPDTVVALTKDNFLDALNDPENPFWLLKFYAPWCGHCKRLAPVLDTVAPQTSGQMTIGTIDCTVEKALCDKHKVRGYPTLKYAVGGDIMDYPKGRSESEFLSFAQKMSGPAVTLVESLEEAKATTKTSDVVFVGYHPSVVTVDGDLDAKLASSRLTKVYGEVARKNLASGTFLLVDTSKTESDEAAASAVAEFGEGPFICRLEDGVEPRCYYRISDSMELAPLHEWVLKENQGTVVSLGAENFNQLGRKGRPLCIAVTGSREHVGPAKEALTRYALSGPEAVRNKYLYAYMDGVQWKRFLSQFEVDSKALPHVFILDVPTKRYWTNSTYGIDIDKFMAAVQDGTVPKKRAGEGGVKGFLEDALRFVVDWMPWSLGVIVILLLACIVSICRCCFSAAKGLRPPYPRKEETGNETEVKEEETTEETKKDK